MDVSQRAGNRGPRHFGLREGRNCRAGSCRRPSGEVIRRDAIVLKTVGLAEPLRDALKTLSSAIRAAFVYGSGANATDQSASDIDLMIISDSLTYREVFGALERVTRTVGRKVNPTVYTAAELSKRARTESAFVTRVLEQPKLWVIGSEDDLPVAA
jgi:predicted nucleotidyltransferase